MGALTVLGPTARFTYMHIALSAVLGALLGVLCVYAAARRSAAQPTGAHPAAEAALIGAVLADPATFRLVVAVEPDAFAWAPHQTLWSQLFDLAVDDTDPDNVAEAEAAGLPSLQLPFNGAELTERLERDGALDGVAPAALQARPLSRTELLAEGTKVLTGAADRRIAGAAPAQPGPSVDEPLVRTVVAPGGTRVMIAAAAAAAAMAAIAATGASAVVMGAAAVLVAGSVVAAFVDIDTLYVDFWSVAFMSLAGGALGVVAAGERLAENALIAGIATLAIVGTLEAVAFVWSKVRRRVGLGGGDSLLLAPLIAVPVLCTGVAETGLWGLLAALALTVAGQLLLIATGRATRDTQFPWVPYLVCGWPIGWYLAVTFGVY